MPVLSKPTDYLLIGAIIHYDVAESSTIEGFLARLEKKPGRRTLEEELISGGILNADQLEVLYKTVVNSDQVRTELTRLRARSVVHGDDRTIIARDTERTQLIREAPNFPPPPKPTLNQEATHLVFEELDKESQTPSDLAKMKARLLASGDFNTPSPIDSQLKSHEVRTRALDSAFKTPNPRELEAGEPGDVTMPVLETPPPPRPRPEDQATIIDRRADLEATHFDSRPPDAAKTVVERPDLEATAVTKPPTPTPGPAVSSTSSTSASGVASRVSSSRPMSEEDVNRIRRVTKGQSDSLIGVNLGGYQINGKLGSGGMGDVFTATQLSLNRPVALKVLPPKLAANEEFIVRFYKEARTLATITHANIVQVYDVAESEGLHYFTMEQVKGRTLRDLLEENEAGVSVEVCTNMMKQCVRGLNRAMKEGVIHRDIKPGNILIDSTGEVKLVDFGLAEIVGDAGKLASTEVVGTPLYISPEQSQARDVSFHTDMYSLGATFYHLLTGKPPFRGKSSFETTRMHVESPVPNPGDINTALPGALCGILMKMLAKNPSERFASYEELFKAIETFEVTAGIIKSPSDFLSDSLLSLGERSVQSLWTKIGFMAVVGGTITLLAIGLRNLFESFGLKRLNDMAGDTGTVLLALTILFITYVAMARKRIVPVVGQIRYWMNAHIVCAIGSFFLVSVHAGNFFRYLDMNHGRHPVQLDTQTRVAQVAHIPFWNSMVFLIVIVSGLVGRVIWRDVVRQVTVERIQKGHEPVAEDSRFTLSVFSQTVFKYWRIVHYPLAVALVLLTVLHVVSILYYRGS